MVRCSLGASLWKLSLLYILACQLGCRPGAPPAAGRRGDAGEGSTATALQLQAKTFKSGGNTPTEFTCDGLNASPGLTWTQPPARTQSFALIMRDPDAAPRASVHWVVYDVPAGTLQISEGMPRRDELIDGTRQGLNDFGKLGYSGPCLAPGKIARYFFKLYALDTKLRLKSQSTKEDLERAMDGHILAQASLTESYSRQPGPPK
jgi:Raf kinase inhibitor-like YbhB/YbcL family protein